MSDVAQIFELEVPDEVFLEFFADDGVQEVSSDFVLEEDEGINAGHVDVALDDLVHHPFWREEDQGQDLILFDHALDDVAVFIDGLVSGGES